MSDEKPIREAWEGLDVTEAEDENGPYYIVNYPPGTPIEKQKEIVAGCTVLKSMIGTGGGGWCQFWLRPTDGDPPKIQTDQKTAPPSGGFFGRK